MPPYWIIMPFLNRWDYTEQALKDCLGQVGLPEPPQVLVIAQGVDRGTRDALERWTEREPRLHAWFHSPALPSLSATWNLALRFVWAQGGEVALVVNNDVRLHREMYRLLLAVQLQDPDALFISGVGVTEPQFTAFVERAGVGETYDCASRGGPDFSCFLITRSGHWQYPFDESFVPAYCEDNDCHRRYMLGGDGHRIFSVNLPYLHYGSGTVNADPAKAAAWAKRIGVSRAHYIKKWGGDVNHERFTIPFDESTAQEHVTNPELQARYRKEPSPDAPSPSLT